MGFMLMLIYLTGYGQSGGLFYYGMYGKVQLTPVTDEYTLEFSSPPDTASLAAVGIYTRRLAPMVYTTDASFATVVSAAPGNYDFQPVLFFRRWVEVEHAQSSGASLEAGNE